MTIQNKVGTAVSLNADMGLACRKLAAAHLQAAGFDNPLETIAALYKECLPDEDDYSQEVRTFETDYFEAMRKAAYLRTIEEIAADDADEYARLYELGRCEEDRCVHGGDRYERLISEIPPFNPPPSKGFFERFDDHPDDVHERVLTRAAELAKERLRQRR